MTYVINSNISEAFIPHCHSFSVVSVQVQLHKNIHQQRITRAVLTCLFYVILVTNLSRVGRPIRRS